MTNYPIFLSVVVVVKNQAEFLEEILVRATSLLGGLVSDYELVVVDNASDDESVYKLKQMSGPEGLPNLQVYALTKEVDSDTAAWVGMENALGDYVAVIDPFIDDLNFLRCMLEEAVLGVDVVFAHNKKQPKHGTFYRVAHAFFQRFYKMLNGVSLAKEGSRYRVISRSVINFILQHPTPSLTYRHLPLTGGFSRSNLEYFYSPRTESVKKLGESVDRGVRLIVSTTRTPMRLVTALSLFGAVANLVYSVYVIAVVLLKADVASGWTSISLQLSGMFFLISLVLLVLGEYVLHMASISNSGPAYHVGQEFTSSKIIRREKLNVEGRIIRGAGGE